MSNSKNQILVQNVETFETITRLTVATDEGETVSQRVDQYFSKNANWGIVSLDDDADGEYMSVLLVAPVDGPDFVMDDTTGEMEPVETHDVAAEVQAKVDIMLDLDDANEELFAAITVQDNMNDASQEDILAAIQAETTPEPAATITPKPAKPRKARKSKAKSNKPKTKGAKVITPTAGKKVRNFEILAALIESKPGISRTDVFQDPGLLVQLRTKPQMQAIANGDKLEVKRWNRRLNFLIREMRRQGVDIQIERKGRIAHYTIGKPSGQLELPFDEAAEARNATIIGDDAENVVIEKPAVDPKRATEAPDQSLDFEALLATLDEEAVAPVTK